ncbi:MAG: CoA ester lyase [Granulosicoccus sp.]
MNEYDAKDCRSVLYMPANNQRAVAKGPTLNADAIILDLEDSVGVEEKVTARSQAVKAIGGVDYGHRVKAIRINSAETVWHKEDVAAVAEAQPHALVIPKVESAEDIIAVSDLLDSMPNTDHINLWAMIESPLAVLNAKSIATESGNRLKALLIGNNDLAKSANMQVSSDRTYLIPWFMQLVAVAHAHSLALFDGVYNNFSDLDGFSRECEEGRAMGMHGKALIHPSQIDITNRIYSPGQDEIEQATAIVEAFSKDENQGVGVLQINGEMVERLHLQMAERLLAKVSRSNS